MASLVTTLIPGLALLSPAQDFHSLVKTVNSKNNGWVAEVPTRFNSTQGKSSNVIGDYNSITFSRFIQKWSERPIYCCFA